MSFSHISRGKAYLSKLALNFLLLIKARKVQQEQLDISILSEPLLAEDWLTPEENEAWQHLQK
jgi:protoheme ferro-lyase